MRVLIAGCGWLGKALGRVLVSRGDHVIGLRRNPAARPELAAAGIEPLILDLDSGDVMTRLPDGIDGVVACPAPDSRSVDGYRATYVEAMAVLIARYGSEPARGLIYTGSTGVFGQTDGRTVDERSERLPVTPTARVLVEAEQQVLASPAGMVLRLSGLYGPGRYGIIDRVRSGRLARPSNEGRWMNFCHRDDAVGAVVAALDRGAPGTVYHASDQAPTRSREVVRWIAANAGVSPHAEQPGAGVTNRPDRRVDASWSRATLGLELAFPSFREGLSAAISRGG